MFDASNNARPQGVGISDGQRTQRSGGLNTLVHFEPTEMFGVQYVDDAGVVHDTVVMRVGARWYLPPNGEVWSKSLRPLKGDMWLAKQLNEALSARGAPVPKADTVDVLGTDKK